MLLPHLGCHHIFDILVWMKIVIDLILIEIGVHLIKARNPILELALLLNKLLLFAGIIVSRSRYFILEILVSHKLGLRL